MFYIYNYIIHILTGGLDWILHNKFQDRSSQGLSLYFLHKLDNLLLRLSSLGIYSYNLCIMDNLSPLMGNHSYRLGVLILLYENMLNIKYHLFRKFNISIYIIYKLGLIVNRQKNHLGICKGAHQHLFIVVYFLNKNYRIEKNQCNHYNDNHSLKKKLLI